MKEANLNKFWKSWSKIFWEIGLLSSQGFETETRVPWLSSSATSVAMSWLQSVVQDLTSLLFFVCEQDVMIQVCVLESDYTAFDFE